MSMGREAIEESYIDMFFNDKRDARFELACYLVNEKIWKTADKQILKIADMEESHIFNCINMLRKNPNKASILLVNMFLQELKDRGINAN